MQTITDAPGHTELTATLPTAPFTPIPSDQRIAALDVVRGFALMGIFMMNIEYFNRSLSAMNEGIPMGLSGIDYYATWFVNYFVQGKFWTIFSLLFGMGFAVMMTRAERAGRPFTKPYLRRILALAVFGAVHFIFLWPGDILFSYAVAAGALLILLYGNWRYIVGALVIAFGLGFIADSFFAIVAGLVMLGLMALYLRNERIVTLRGYAMPVISVVFLSIGVLLSIAAIVFWLLPDGPKEPRAPLSAFGPVMLILAVLSAKYHNPVEKRGVRLGVTAYLFMAVSMTIGGAIQYLTPPAPDAPVLMNQTLVKSAAGWRIASILPIPLPAPAPAPTK